MKVKQTYHIRITGEGQLVLDFYSDGILIDRFRKGVYQRRAEWVREIVGLIAKLEARTLPEPEPEPAGDNLPDPDGIAAKRAKVSNMTPKEHERYGRAVQAGEEESPTGKFFIRLRL